MKILHVIETLGPGGAEQMLTTLLPALARRGHEVFLGVLRPPLDLEASVEAGGVHVTLLGSQHKWNLFRGTRAVADCARACDADIVHAHLFFPAIYVGLARLSGRMRARTCVTFHNLAYQRGVNRPGPGLLLRRLLNALIVRFGLDGHIAVSDAAAAHYRRKLWLRDIVVIPNPLDLEGIEAALTARAKSPPRAGEQLHIILPGRLVREKGHAMLLRALLTLKAQGSRFRATFAGEGPLRPQIEAEIAALGLVGGVMITGRLHHADMLALIAGADIAVTPSLAEGFGLAALESLALGRPLVASRAGGLPEIVTHDETGLLIDPGDEIGLAAALQRLVTNAALRLRLGEAGRAFARTRFSPDHIAARHESCYAALLQRDA